MKKILSILVVAALLLCLAACGGNSDTPSTTVSGTDVNKYANVKIGLIMLHDPSASTYDANFYNALLEVQKKLGLTDDQLMVKWNVPEEGSECYDTACDFADAGCQVVFADSFGHESNMLLAAKDNPNTQFSHATGVKAHTEKLPNYHNAFANIYQGRFLAGVAAGLKLNEMIESGKITADGAKIGYVGAWPYAEVKSGYTSFFLGARSVCPSATMEVVYTNSWFDIALEKEGAEKLINNGCVLISQHADSEGAPKACEAAGVPNIAYNLDTTSLGPTTAIVSSKINWAPYFELLINSIVDGTAIQTDYCGTIESGSVELTKINDVAAAKGTAEKIEEVKAKLVSGEIKVFDTKTFTVNGAELTSYLADVDDMGDFKGETEVIENGEFAESKYRSAPYFDIIIDGITEK